MKKKFILSLSLCAALMSSSVMADVVSDPASLSDVSTMLTASDFRTAVRHAIRKELKRLEATEGKLDIDLMMSPLTDEVIDRLYTQKVGKYWSAKYAKQYVAQLGSPAGKLTAKLYGYAAMGNSSAELQRLSMKDKLAIAEVQRGLPFKSLENATMQGGQDFVRAAAEYVSEQNLHRAQESNKFFLQYLEAVNAFAEGKVTERPVIQPPVRSGIIKSDSENQLLYQFILKRDQYAREFDAKLNNGKLIEEMLSTPNMADPVILERNLIALAEIEELRTERIVQFDKLLESYFEVNGGQQMSAAERRRRIKLADSDVSQIMASMIESSEVELSFFASIRRLLLVCQAAGGKLKFENQRLIFNNDKDLREFEARRLEYLKAREELNMLTERDRKRRDHLIQDLRTHS